MGIQNSLKLGTLGLGLDAVLYGNVTGRSALMGGLVGLFVPDGQSVREVYDEYANLGPSRHEGGSMGLFGNQGFGLFEGLFGTTDGTPSDPQGGKMKFDLKSMLALGAAALMFTKVGGFSLPLYGAYLTGMIPYNKGGLEPLLWSSGLIPPSIGGLWGGWGATAGLR